MWPFKKKQLAVLPVVVVSPEVKVIPKPKFQVLETHPLMEQELEITHLDGQVQKFTIQERMYVYDEYVTLPYNSIVSLSTIREGIEYAMRRDEAFVNVSNDPEKPNLIKVSSIKLANFLESRKFDETQLVHWIEEE